MVILRSFALTLVLVALASMIPSIAAVALRLGNKFLKSSFHDIHQIMILGECREVCRVATAGSATLIAETERALWFPLIYHRLRGVGGGGGGGCLEDTMAVSLLSITTHISVDLCVSDIESSVLV